MRMYKMIACRAVHWNACLVLILVLSTFSIGWSERQRFIDSREYNRDFHGGIIKDYSDMVEGKDVNWVWIDPSAQLAHYRIIVNKVDNSSDVNRASLATAAKFVVEDFSAAINEKDARGTLIAELCIYEAQEFSRGKRWIPYVGRHQSQAGVGIEMVLHDENNRTIAKFRNFGRSGTTLRRAVEAVVSDIMNYISTH